MTKTEEIRKVLQQQNADAAWITTPLNVYYFTGYRSEPHERLFALLVQAMAKMFYFVRKWRLKKSKLHLSTGKSLVI